MANSRKFRR